MKINEKKRELPRNGNHADLICFDRSWITLRSGTHKFNKAGGSRSRYRRQKHRTTMAVSWRLLTSARIAGSNCGSCSGSGCRRAAAKGACATCGCRVSTNATCADPAIHFHSGSYLDLKLIMQCAFIAVKLLSNAPQLKIMSLLSRWRRPCFMTLLLRRSQRHWKISTLQF